MKNISLFAAFCAISISHQSLATDNYQTTFDEMSVSFHEKCEGKGYTSSEAKSKIRAKIIELAQRMHHTESAIRQFYQTTLNNDENFRSFALMSGAQAAVVSRSSAAVPSSNRVNKAVPVSNQVSKLSTDLEKELVEKAAFGLKNFEKIRFLKSVKYESRQVESYLDTLDRNNLAHFKQAVLATPESAKQFINRQFAFNNLIEKIEGKWHEKTEFSFWTAQHFRQFDLSQELLKTLFGLSPKQKAIVAANIDRATLGEHKTGILCPASLQLLACECNEAMSSRTTPINLVWNHRGDQSKLALAIVNAFKEIQIPGVFVDIMSQIGDDEQVILCEAVQLLTRNGTSPRHLQILELLKSMDLRGQVVKLPYVLRQVLLVVDQLIELNKDKTDLTDFIKGRLTQTLEELEESETCCLGELRTPVTLRQFNHALDICIRNKEKFTTQAQRAAVLECVIAAGDIEAQEIIDNTPSDKLQQKLQAVSIYRSVGGTGPVDEKRIQEILEARPVLEAYIPYVSRTTSMPEVIAFLIGQRASSKRCIEGFVHLEKLTRYAKYQPVYQSIDVRNFLTLFVHAPDSFVKDLSNVSNLCNYVLAINPRQLDQASLQDKMMLTDLVDIETMLGTVQNRHAKEFIVSLLLEKSGGADVRVNVHFTQSNTNFIDKMLKVARCEFLHNAEEYMAMYSLCENHWSSPIESLMETVENSLRGLDHQARARVISDVKPTIKQLTFHSRLICSPSNLIFGLTRAVGLESEAKDKVLSAIGQIVTANSTVNLNCFMDFPGNPFSVFQVLISSLYDAVLRDEKIEVASYRNFLDQFSSPTIIRRFETPIMNVIDSISKRTSIHHLNMILLPIIQVSSDWYQPLLENALAMLENDCTLEEIGESAACLGRISARIRQELDHQHPVSVAANMHGYGGAFDASYKMFYRLVIGELGLRPLKVMRAVEDNLSLAIKAFLTVQKRVSDEDRDELVEALCVLLTKETSYLQNFPEVYAFVREQLFDGRPYDQILGAITNIPDLRISRPVFERVSHILKKIDHPVHKLMLFTTFLGLPEQAMNDAMRVFETPESIQRISQISVENPDLHLIFSVLSENTEWNFDTLKPFWREALLSGDIEVVKMVYQYLAALTQGQEELNVLDDFYQAIAGAELRLDQQNYKTSPFYVYKKLQKKRARSVVLAKTPVEVLSGQHVCVDPYYFENKLTAQVVRVDQLPSFDILGFFRGQVKRLNGLFAAEETRQQFLVEFGEFCGDSWQNFSAEVLGSHELESYIDFTRFDRLQPIPLVRARFCQILSYVRDQDKTVPETRLLSPCDEAFIKWMYGVANCKPGKAEGVNNAYSTLEPQYKLKTRNDGDDAIPPCVELVHGNFIDVVEEFIAGKRDRNFVFELCALKRGDMLEQAPHQKTYIRNLLPFLGPLTFDAHSRVIYTALIQRSRSEVMDALFKRLTPRHLVDSTFTFLNSALSKPKSTTFSVVSDYLGTDERFWDFDTDSGKTRITQDGTLFMLKKMGVLKEHDPHQNF